MAVVRVLPANRERTVVDDHDEHDLPLQGLSLIMCEDVSILPGVLTAVAGIQQFEARI